jgi:DNA-binding beta-propeller fold protein YncE
VATGPGGQRVFVTGQSFGDFATVAYSAATGKRLWVQRYKGPGGGADTPASLAVSASGSELIVTGTAGTRGSRIDTSLVTIAYSVATGKRLWIQRVDGPAGGGASAGSLATSPAGSRVYVTGAATSAGGERTDLLTIGYGSATGRRLWLTRSIGRCHSGGDAIAVSPSGRGVFVAGSSGWCPDIGTFLTTAYAAGSGRKLWVKQYMGQARYAYAGAIAVSPDGQRVYVTGNGNQGFTNGAMTVAYAASAGARLWAARYGGDAFYAVAKAVTVSPDAATVYITGAVETEAGGLDYVTIAYNAATGARLWRASYGSADNLNDAASAMALSPDGRTIFITGTSTGKTSLEDFLTVAYRS